MLKFDMSRVYLDYMFCFRREALVMSVYDRSLQMVRAFCASVNLSEGRSGLKDYDGSPYFFSDSYDVHMQAIQCGKEKVYCALMVSKKISDSIVLTTEETKGRDFYRLLMKKFDFPLLEWWGQPLLEIGVSMRAVNVGYCNVYIIYGENAVNKGRDLCGVPLESLIAYSLDLYDKNVLKSSIKQLFEERKIWISQKRQKVFSPDMDMDEYFQKYGHTVAANLERKIKPLKEIDGNMEGMTLTSMRLYPQQCAIVNAGVELLQTSDYCIQNEGMGTGKTAQSISIAEMYMIRQWLKRNPGKNVKDVYSSLDTVKYRHIIMCPGHLVRKWAKEIREQIPFSEVVELTEFRQLVELRNRGFKRTGKEFYVMSMDFGKLTYMQQPVPTKIKHFASVHYKKCKACGENYLRRGNECPNCSAKGFVKGELFMKTSGLVCPDCGEILLGQAGNDLATISALQVWDFAAPSLKNSKCLYCGTSLWQPFVRNVKSGFFIDDIEAKSKKWIRAAHYTNHTKNATKAVWVLSGHEDDYFKHVGQEPIYIKEDLKGVRKYSPALFIKKYMKNYFDIAILDEVHKCASS